MVFRFLVLGFFSVTSKDHPRERFVVREVVFAVELKSDTERSPALMWKVLMFDVLGVRRAGWGVPQGVVREVGC